MKKIFYLTAIFFLFISCSQNTFEEILFRTTSEPFQDIIEADSLSLEHTVYLNWKEDDASDVFRLMKSYDQTTLNFTCIYEGQNTSYTDTDLTDKNRYIYRLDKIRGSKYFEGENFAYAYSADYRKDECEPNDTEDNATLLESDLICNLPCVMFLTDNWTSIDEDWFYINIPPRRTADIIISQYGLENETVGTSTNLKIQVRGSESSPVQQKVAIPINNTSYETKRFCFKVYPESTGLFSQDSYTSVIEYTISLNQIRNYVQ